LVCASRLRVLFGHDVLAVDDLVALPVVGQQHEVVGEAHVGACRWRAHRILPGHW
jgi:hypothetical protein